MTITKKVPFHLVGQDGNAFALLGGWKDAARRADWTPEEISAVIDEAMSGDYDHLLQVLMAHSDMSEEEEIG